MRKILLLLLAISSLNTYSVTAEDKDQPRRVVLNQDNGTVVYYMYKNKRYRAVDPSDIPVQATAVPVCINAKLRNKLDNELSFFGDDFNRFKVMLATSSSFSAERGDNLWLGGTVSKTGKTAIFKVNNFAKLADDLKLFTKRYKILESTKDTSAQDWLRLAWWIKACEKQAFGVTANEFKQYGKDRSLAYKRFFETEEQGLDNFDKHKIAARIKRYANFVSNAASKTLTGDENWHTSQYRNLLHRNKTVIDLLQNNNEPQKTAADKLLGEIIFMLGKMKSRYLSDQNSARALFVKAAQFIPLDEELGKELREIDYRLINGKWMNKEQAETEDRKQKEEKRRMAAERARIARVAAQNRAHHTMIRGDDMEKSLTVVDSLLSKPGSEIYAELASQLDSLPEDVCRYTIWKVGENAKALDVETFSRKALKNKSANVRMDVIDLMLARLGTDAMRGILKQMETDSDAAVKRHAVLAIAHLPANSDIECLIEILRVSAIPADLRKLAAQHLALKTGQNFGLNDLKWSQWWKTNSKGFKRD